MTVWTKNNLSHRRTYLCLRILSETGRKFSSAGSLKIKNLKFWVPGDSSSVRKAKAKSLSMVLNNMFIDAFASEYEVGTTKTKSINAMAKVLENGDKKVIDLANKADEQYDFFGEEP